MFLLIFFVVFSGFYQHWRTNLKMQKIDQWYMEETTFDGALWIKDYVDNVKRLVGNNDLTSTRVLAFSEVRL